MAESEITAEGLLKSLQSQQEASHRVVMAPTAVGASSGLTRRASIDVFRGMVMFLMLAEVLHWSSMLAFREKFTDVGQQTLEWIHFHTSHVAWVGCSLHDMIQPAFSFLVGTSLAFSISKRTLQGQSWEWMFMHAVLRSLVLIFLGIFLRSLGKPITNFTFDDTLTQIGLGYGLLFLFADRKPVAVGLGVVCILLFYWLVFALYPLPKSGFD